MLKKFTYLLLTFVFITSCFSDDALATTGNLTGSVKQSGSGEPLAEATISLEGESAQSTLSGDDGNFTFTELITGSYQVSVSKGGYVNNTKPVIIYPAKTASSGFSLQKRIPVANPKKVELTRDKREESIELKNPQADVMNYTTSTSKNWITVSPANGSIESNNIELIKITADLTTITPGTYDETMVINVDGATLSIPVKVIYDKAPYINVTKPTKDEEYKMGESMIITWDSNLDGKVKIDLLKESSVNSSISSETLNKEGGSFNWNIPALDPDYYKVLVTSTENPSISFTTEPFKLNEGPTPPVVTTAIGASEVGVSYIKVKGTITALGIQATQVDQYGHVYSVNEKIPTVADAKTEYGITKDTLTYTSDLTQLNSGETYYVRAYATNSKGSSYGKVITATTTSGAPVVSTFDAYEVSENSAKSGGNLTSDGGSTITERGLLYGKTEKLNADSEKIIDNEAVKGAYVSTLIALARGTKYYIKAYAKNSSGFGYGKLKFFYTIGDPPEVQTKSVDDVYGTRVKVSGKVTNNGGEPLNSYGFAYGKSKDPSIDDNKLEVGIVDVTDYSGQIEGLTISTEYFVRAFATNARGTSYGENKKFTTTNGLPSMVTISSQDIFGTNAVINGKIEDNGGSPTVSYGFAYAETPNPAIDGFKVEAGKVGTGEYNGKLTGLKVSTKYYVRAYATNSNGTGYGTDINFTTLDGLPEVKTVGSEDITVTSAKLSGSVVKDGGDTLTSYGFVYGESKSPTVDGDKLEVGETISGAYSGSIQSLKTLIKYYYRAYATNSTGTSYGDELDFTTKEGPYLTITSPQANQTLPPTGSFTIVWETNITDKKVSIQHWRDGAKISDISTETDITAKSIVWTVNDEKSTNNKIKIIDNADNTKVYESSLFKIDNLTYVPDDVFESWMINKGYDDVLDDYVLTERLRYVRETLELKNLNISDLTGIEAFKSIDIIKITNLKVTTIDLSLIKDYLYTFQIYDNPNLESIILDDLVNTRLQYLYISRNPKLKQISSLRKMSLTSIDFVDNPKLESLILPSGLGRLTGVSIYNTDPLIPGILSSIDFKTDNFNTNTSIQTLNLKNNNLSDNDFTWMNGDSQALYIGGNPLITCVKINSFLYQNSSFNVGIDHKTQYITDDCSKDITIVSDDNFEQILIDLGYDDIKDNGVSTQSLKTITTLNMPDKGISDLTGLEAMTALKELYIEKNNINNTYSYDNSTYNFDFSKNTELEVLSMWSIDLYNGILDLSKNTKLKTLNIQNNTSWSVRGGLDVSMLTNLTTFDATGLAVGCIKVSQSQLDNIPAGWDKDANEIYAIDCTISGTVFTDPRDGKSYTFKVKTTSGMSQTWFYTDLAYETSKSYNPYYDDVKNGSTPIYTNTNLYWVDDTGAIPSGWHIPSKEEWVTMFTALGSTVSDSGPGDSKTYPGAALKLKSKSDVNWTNDCTGKTKAGSSTSYGLVLRTHRWRAVNNGSTTCNEDGSLFGVTYLSSTSKMIDGKKYHYTYTISMSDAGYYDDVIERLELVSSDSVYPGDQSKNIAQGKYMIKLIKDE